MNRVFKNSPLPFQGQKRRFVKDFEKALELYPSNGIYIDLFGGSGLLSHTVKQKYPNATVIYNDFDDFSKRLKNIPKTNALLNDLRAITKDWSREKRIVGNVRQSIIDRVSEEKGFVDYITISSSLLFSAKYVTSYQEFIKQTFYNNVRKSDYDANGYLENVELVKLDYKDLFEKYKENKRVIYLVDPPYLSTDVSTYSNKKFWKLKDYLDVSNTLNNGKYFYFTSNRSHIIELMDWVADNTGGVSPFNGAVRTTINQQLNHNAKYTDIMLYKGWVSSITK